MIMFIPTSALAVMKTVITAVFVCVLLTLAACSRITRENYAKLEAGMTREEVYRLLGKPDDVSGSGIGQLTLTTETWTGPKHIVRVTFAGDKVTLKRIQPRQE